MTQFTSFAFPASLGTADRTMPDRLSEIKNVKDFGAVGDGVTDDRAAIQAAIDWDSGANRGIIYFPATSAYYVVGSPGLTLNYNGALSIILRGDGSASRIVSAFNGFQFTRSLGTAANDADILFENMHLTNSGATGGNCRIGSAKKVAFRDCNFTGHISLTTENTDGADSSETLLVSSCIFAKGGDTTGSRGIIMGGGGVIEGTDLRGYDVGYRIYGVGTTIWGGRSERNNTCMELGVGTAAESRGSATDVGLKGLCLVGHSFEGNWTVLDFLGTVEGAYVGSLQIQGHSSSNSGADAGIQNTQRAIYIRADKLRGALFHGVSCGDVHDIAGIEIEDATSRAYITFAHCAPNPAGAGADWIKPTNAYTAKFIDCNTDGVFTFAGLPGASDRLEGDEYDISDSNTATWGATAAGGGANRVRVRFNGTNWTVMGV